MLGEHGVNLDAVSFGLSLSSFLHAQTQTHTQSHTLFRTCAFALVYSKAPFSSSNHYFAAINILIFFLNHHKRFIMRGYFHRYRGGAVLCGYSM